MRYDFGKYLKKLKIITINAEAKKHSLMSQSYSKSFIKDNAVVLSGHILIYLKGIILLPILIKSVGVTVYGGYTLVIATLGLLFGISSFGAGFCKRFLPSSVEKSDRQLLFYPQFLFSMSSILFLSLI